MSVHSLPETITKDKLFKYAQEEFEHLIKIYADPRLSAQHMYEVMCCSVFGGDPAYDFPDEKQDDTTRYQYEDGSCYFIVDGIKVEVFDLCSMRVSSRVDKETYVDVCVPCITYKDETNGNFMYHPIPGAWLYGSTSEDFNEGQPVHRQFIYAAQEYIKEHHITKDMQEED